ncbi:MAG: hypothetical protein ABW106_00270 [Steroidobacteraceae bacterium]
MLLLSVANAEPYIPKDDATVLERAPAAEATRRLEPLRRMLIADPTDFASALQLAQGYLTIGRETADPRFTSYAQATIAPWLQAVDPPAAALVLQATVLQSSHQFDASLSMLDRALRIEPGNAQAWLTRATVLQVQGKFALARQSCGNLLRTAGQAIAISCIANVNSLNGKLEQSYRSLRQLHEVSQSSSADIRGWMLGQLGEMAVRMGDPQAAEKYFLAAMQATPGDIYLKAAYADLLLAQNRHEAVIALLQENEQQDVLLLRLAIAGKRLQSPEAKRWSDSFEARYLAAQRGGDSSHLREYARFLLDVRGDPRKALEVARRNWRVQREPADVHVYLMAATAANSSDGAAEVTAWIRENGYEDRTLPAAGKTTS